MGDFSLTLAIFTEKNMNDPLKAFGIRLSSVRRKCGLSQERLVLESGLARSYLSGIERGKRNVSLLNIHKIADTLGVSAYVLLQDGD